jgi:hypothetical protein
MMISSQVSSARRLVDIRGKINIFKLILRLLPIVGSECHTSTDRDGIFFPKMVWHVQKCLQIYELGCSGVKKNSLARALATKN